MTMERNLENESIQEFLKTSNECLEHLEAENIKSEELSKRLKNLMDTCEHKNNIKCPVKKLFSSGKEI